MRYYGGERVQESGIYRSVHTFHREHDGEHALTVGQYFPHCAASPTECRDVVYTLIKAAPGTQEDKDFKTEGEVKRKRSAGD